LAGPAAELDISPDGRNIVYIVGGAPNVQQMYLQALGQLEPQSFPNIGNPIYPVFSPTGDWIAFFDLASRTIRKVQASGGSPVTIAPRSNAAIRGMSWASDDTIVFGTGDPATGVMRVSAAGGTPEVLTKPDGSKGESGHWFPHPLPDGRGVLFTVAASPAPNVEDLRTAVFNSRTGEYRTILTGAFSARYVPTGHIVYATAGGTLRAARFNLDRLEVVGQGVPVVEQVITKQSGALSANVSSNGTLAYLRGVAAGSERSLAWIDRDGREEPILAPIRAYAYPRLSPDGTRVALDIRDQENDTWIWDLNRKTLTRLTFDPGPNRGVVWSPDGKHIAFSAQRDGVETIHWQSADGTGAPEKLTEGTQSQFPSAFTPDGQFLLFQEPAAAPRDIYLLNLADGKVQPLLASPKFNEDNPQVSPNGRWLAYESNQSGRDDIYVRPFPNVDGAGGVLVSTGGGTQPLWSRTGKELFYLVRPSTIMAVPVDIATPSFSAGNPEAVVNGGFMAPPFSGLSYSVSPDGKRFLVIKDPRTSSAPPQLVLAFNWLEELERLVP
jgi:serine/threonine-protein kinase